MNTPSKPELNIGSDGKEQGRPIQTTVVGGRPVTEDRRRLGVPRGIEVLIAKASVDQEFRGILLERRAEAADEIGLSLSRSEAATLNAIPRSHMEQIINRTRIPDEHRRVFLGKLAAAMLAVMSLGLGLTNSDEAEATASARKGTRQDEPDDEKQPVKVAPVKRPRPRITGMRSDRPRPRMPKVPEEAR